MQAARAGNRHALEIGRIGAGALVQPPPLVGIIDNVVGGQDRRGPRACDAERLALPEDRAVLVDDACRVEHCPGGQVVP